MHQSELALFDQEFRRVLGPLEEALADARAHLAAAGELPAARELQASLSGLQDELAGLLTRVAEERATVFVFGPAKGGKSTLVEALAGVRTGGPTLLPGYPCLAQLRHGPLESAHVTAFDGTTSTASDPAALTLTLQRAQAELAAHVRASRARGEVFDPPRHLPRALRRIARTLPAPALAHGALELIECPPIHAPLFAGYGEMWLGEPERTRAAVFVVRAAQLADDTLFDGIEELLARFQPLFLVLNVDTRAKELAVGGELGASLEGQEPARLVAAFEEHSTVQALAQAVADGSAPVFALDLLEAAAARRRGAEEPAGPLARLGDLERALAGVLDAHDALRALTGSALRRAAELVTELRELAPGNVRDELARRVAEAGREETALAGRLALLERFAGRERARWEAEPFFDELGARLASATLSRARALAQELSGPFARAVEDWFASGASLAELVAGGLAPRLAAAREELARSAERVLGAYLAPPAVPHEPDERAARLTLELEAGGLVLAELLAAAADGLGGSAAAEAPAALRVLDVATIPVRARLGQRLTWRSDADVRRALFGPPEAPGAALSSREKAERLGEEGREALRRSTHERALAILEEDARHHARHLSAALVTRFLAELQRVVAATVARARQPQATLAARSAGLAARVAALDGLASALASAAAGVGELAERFAPRPGTDTVLVPASRTGTPVRARESLRASAPREERV